MIRAEPEPFVRFDRVPVTRSPVPKIRKNDFGLWSEVYEQALGDIRARAAAPSATIH